MDRRCNQLSENICFQWIGSGPVQFYKSSGSIWKIGERGCVKSFKTNHRQISFSQLLLFTALRCLLHSPIMALLAKYNVILPDSAN